MPAAPPALPRSAPEDEVDLRFLEYVADQSRRVSIAVFCVLVVIAVIVGSSIPYWITGVWFALAASLMLARRWILSALPLRDDLALAWRVRIAAALSLANGLAHGLALGAFPFLGQIERAFLSVLMLGLCTGAVGTSSGRRIVFLAYAIPTMLPQPLLWLWSGLPRGDSLEISLAVLIALNIPLLMGSASNAWKTFEESVLIRFKERDLNAQLQQALTRANEASLAKTRFLASASHDLRQPLHTIGLLVAALSIRPVQGRDKEIIDLLSQVTAALSEQLDQLLDISRLDAGVIPVEKRLVSLDEVLRQHFAEVRGAIEAKGLRASLRSDDAVHVSTDPALLLRILRNLTENAIKFTSAGSIGFGVAASAGDACITVTDTGCGIGPDEQRRVFEEFYQVGNPERDRSRGLGLGLSIVQRLAGLLGIALAMRSDLGQGTRFELRLPLSAAPAEPLATQVPRPVRALDARVLVIDDERSVRAGVRILLEEFGCACSEAGSTEEALASVGVSRPDIVLADMRLRGGDSGIDAVRAIRALVGPVPALLVSGDTAPHRLQEAAGAGIRLLHKPVSMEVLRSAIEEAIHGGRRT